MPLPWKSLKITALFLAIGLAAFLTPSAFHFVFAQNSAHISIHVATPVPSFSITATGGDTLEVHWNWDAISPGYFPPAVTDMQVEISSDGLNYGQLQHHLASDFGANYGGLNIGDYTARITVMDGGNNYDYVVGPVHLTGAGRSRAPLTTTTDVTMTGLAYPGPSTVVIFTYNGAFQTSITTDADGVFSFNTTSLPAGSGAFSFSAKDPNNVLSVPVSFSATVPDSTPVTLNPVYLPPTIALNATVVTVGQSLQASGYAYKNGTVSLELDGPTSRVYLAQVDAQGFWTTSIDTSLLSAGTYNVFATSTSSGGSIVSPNSDTAVFQLVTTLQAAPICGNGLLESPEQCDDGNLFNGDGCSSTCQLETGLPQSRVDQPSPSTFTADPVTLTYTASSTKGSITAVHLWYSRNGAPYAEYPTVFTASPVLLTGLIDGDYEIYSIAEDSAGFTELVPTLPDAAFVVDKITQLSVLAYPEKRVPRQGNWSMPGTLTLYQPGTKTLLHQYDITTDDQGRADIPALDLPKQNYNFLFKGGSYLSKRLDSTAFQGIDLLLDFTLGGSFFLLGGDVHSDDYINGLDLSATIPHLYTSFPDADFAHDGIVNGMDISIIVSNLFKKGDGA